MPEMPRTKFNSPWTVANIEAELNGTKNARGNLTMTEKFATKQDTLAVGVNMDSVPTAEGTNPVASGGVFSAIAAVETPDSLPDKTDPQTQELYADIQEADSGWWKRATNLSRVRNMPSDYSGGFIIHVINTTLANRKMVFFYPQSASDVGSFYTMTQTSSGWSAWYKHTGTAVSPQTLQNASPDSLRSEPEHPEESEVR